MNSFKEKISKLLELKYITRGPYNKVANWFRINVVSIDSNEQIIRFVPLFLVAILIIQFIRTWGYFMDDGYILLRYAQNILNGNGWVFNIGEYYNSATSILQVFLYVVQGLIFGVDNLQIISYIDYYIWLFVMVFFIYRLFLPYNCYVAAFISITITTIPHFYTIFGVETAMNMALLFVALFAYQRKYFNFLYSILSLLILVRIENGLLAAIIFLFLLFKEKLSIPELIKKGVLLLLPFIIWSVFSHVYFGKIFPSSLAAKLWQGSSGDWGGHFTYFKSMFSYLVFSVLPWARIFQVQINDWQIKTSELIHIISVNFLYFMGLLMSFIFIIKGFIRVIKEKKLSEIHILLVWAFVHSLLYGVVFRVPGYHWYYSLFIITIISLFYIGIYAWNYKILYIRTIFLIMFAVSFSLVFIMDTNITIEDSRTIPYSNLSKWINENTNKNAIIIHEEVGEIAYFTNRKIIDGVALTSPQYLPLLRRGLREFFWMLQLSNDSDYYLVSYHDTYPLLRNVLASSLVYDGQDAIKTRLYKIERNKVLFPVKNQTSVFLMNYEVFGPKDRVGQGLVVLQPQNIICPSFGLHAQHSSEEPTELSLINFGKDMKFTSFDFYSLFPMEAIQKGTNGAQIDVLATYDDGSSGKETFIHRIDSVNKLGNNKMFSFKLDKTKGLISLKLRPHDEINNFDWLYICNPVFTN